MDKNRRNKTLRPQSRYVLLAETLEKDIRQGRYPVDSLLPPETKLQEQYSVSRYTVRAALQQLHQLGLINSRPAIGTRVVAQMPMKPTSISMDSFENIVDAIYQYVPKIISYQAGVILSAEIVQALEIVTEKVWTEITVLRSMPKSKLSAMIDQIYIDARYRNFYDYYDGTQSVIMLLYQYYNIKIVEMKQKIQAIQLGKDEADLLKEKLKKPALKIIRYLYDEKKELVAFSIKYCHAKHYTFTSQFRLAHPAA